MRRKRLEKLGNFRAFPDPCAHAGGNRRGLRIGRVHDHGNSGERRVAGAQGKECPPVHDGHVDVEHDQIDAAVANALETRRAVLRKHDVVTGTLEDLSQHAAQLRVIVDDEHRVPPVGVRAQLVPPVHF